MTNSPLSKRVRWKFPTCSPCLEHSPYPIFGLVVNAAYFALNFTHLDFNVDEGVIKVLANSRRNPGAGFAGEEIRMHLSNPAIHASSSKLFASKRFEVFQERAGSLSLSRRIVGGERTIVRMHPTTVEPSKHYACQQLLPHLTLLL
ncbi:hypothetical protein M413DRAFT_13331 [Hebeloma cylindrosporum]|uniref:Uncharacterized protein n=1 Tax=Hebeloma cylindrosporum TaxID=76867 RepID=A0A0C2Y9H6_HEBCY|nr:hypothetical protein M413DRAFT_13331 [Hebeloma cylindrosporum h7]